MKPLKFFLVALMLLLVALLVGMIKGPEKRQESPFPSLPFKVKRTAERGLYITCSTARSRERMAYIKHIMKTRGLNTLVVDVNYAINPQLIPLIRERKLTRDTKVEPNPWLKAFCDEMREEGFIISARVVVFKDDHLVIARPDLSIMLPGGRQYRDHKGGRWADPYSKEVRVFKELMSEIAALSGVDEVQFDYIRFPAEGEARNIVLPHKIEGMSRVDIMCLFLKDVRERIGRYNVSMALDIFGVIAWQSKRDIDILGQDLKRMAEYLDVLSPMLYPSHFHAGYDGFPNPGSEPYHFMHSGVKKSLEILSGEATVLVPWLQGFNLSSPNYGPDYIAAQVKACRDLGVNRFLIWNARNYYDTVPLGIGNY